MHFSALKTPTSKPKIRLIFRKRNIECIPLPMKRIHVLFCSFKAIKPQNHSHLLDTMSLNGLNIWRRKLKKNSFFIPKTQFPHDIRFLKNYSIFNNLIHFNYFPLTLWKELLFIQLHRQFQIDGIKRKPIERLFKNLFSLIQAELYVITCDWNSSKGQRVRL